MVERETERNRSSMRKIEIGCGRKPLKGYETIDIEPYSNANHIGDFRQMHFEDVYEIQTHHLFEHFGRNEAPEILRLWNSWLMPKGRIVIEVPDFEGICSRFTEETDEKKRYWLCRHAFGSQEADWAYHKTGYYESSLTSLLSTCGFRVLKVFRKDSRVYLPNLIMEAEKI
jgi:predicted SAM-dependent methyltransferase